MDVDRAIDAAAHASAASVADVPPIVVVLRELFERKSSVRLVLGGTCGICIICVTNTWLPPFFIRVHELSTAEVGSSIAVCVGFSSAPCFTSSQAGTCRRISSDSD